MKGRLKIKYNTTAKDEQIYDSVIDGHLIKKTYWNIRFPVEILWRMYPYMVKFPRSLYKPPMSLYKNSISLKIQCVEFFLALVTDIPLYKRDISIHKQSK